MDKLNLVDYRTNFAMLNSITTGTYAFPLDSAIVRELKQNLKNAELIVSQIRPRQVQRGVHLKYLCIALTPQEASWERVAFMIGYSDGGESLRNRSWRKINRILKQCKQS